MSDEFVPIPHRHVWFYRVTSEPDHTRVTVAAYREDTPAALPLVTADGAELAEALANLHDSIIEFEEA